jgi:SAM-dependent methyltransferase
MTDQKQKETANSIKEFFKRYPRFYYFVFDVFSPVYFGGLGSKEFLNKFQVEGPTYNLGAGARRIADDVINVDITDYDATDIVADITNLSFEDNSAGRVICDQVLEHVLDPKAVAKEIYRILKPGGYAYISTPFMYPFHASPSDYQRFTHEGLKVLLKDFEIVDIGVRCGPFSTLTVCFCYFVATIFSFGSERLYWFLALATTFIFFPIKFLDIIGNRLPFSINMCSVPYVVVKKPTGSVKG